MVHETHEASDHRNSLEVRSVFLDLSKSFDKVWHEGLNRNSNKMEFERQIPGNYLSNRSQRLMLNDMLPVGFN